MTAIEFANEQALNLLEIVSRRLATTEGIFRALKRREAVPNRTLEDEAKRLHFLLCEMLPMLSTHVALQNIHEKLSEAWSTLRIGNKAHKSLLEEDAASVKAQHDRLDHLIEDMRTCIAAAPANLVP